jgi:hypothetical protein
MDQEVALGVTGWTDENLGPLVSVEVKVFTSPHAQALVIIIV